MNADRSRKILFFVTEDWYFCSHRFELAVAALHDGYQVTVVTRVQNHGDKIKGAGFGLIPIQLQRHGHNPWRDLVLIRQLWRIYRAELPDIVHHVAIKPVLYGSLVARMARIPAVVNALTGLGYVFTSRQLKARLLRPFVGLAYRLLLNRECSKVILQNPDDVRMLTQRRILDPKRIVLIRGSGVDTKKFTPTPEPTGMPVILFPSRMLWDKGVREFVDGAVQLKNEGVQARFVIVGDSDPGNPAAVPYEQLKDWQRSGAVEWWGGRNDMPEVFSSANIVCLPSYREGLPKVLIEAAACGRAIVATDVPGCREIVRHGDNGLLAPARDARALAAALRQLILDPSLRRRMGERGREIVVAEFSVERIAQETLALYLSLLA